MLTRRTFQNSLLLAPFAFSIAAPNAQAQDRQALEDTIDEAVKDGRLAGLHDYKVLLRGEVFAEGHFPGEDQLWGDPLGVVEHGPETLHDLRSVTKSVVSLLYHIALSEGVVPSTDAPLLAQFPEFADLTGDPQRDAITIRHALDMQMGTEWDETTIAYDNPANSEIAMERSPDRYRYALDRPMAGPPGKQWNYNGGATTLIGKIITDRTGMTLDTYANEKLFVPLGIDSFEWAGPGVASAASGLRLTADGLTRIGQMLVQNGQWDGKTILPMPVLLEMLRPRAEIGDGFRYGSFWYFLGPGPKPALVAALGNGGQRLSLSVERQTVLTVFAGRYNDPDAWKVSVKLIEDFIGPALAKT